MVHNYCLSYSSCLLYFIVIIVRREQDCFLTAFITHLNQAMKQLVILALSLAYLEVQGQNNFSSTQGYAVSTAASHVASEASEVKEEKRDQLTGESFRVVEPRGKTSKTRALQALPHLRAAGPGGQILKILLSKNSPQKIFSTKVHVFSEK